MSWMWKRQFWGGGGLKGAQASTNWFHCSVLYILSGTVRHGSQKTDAERLQIDHHD